MRTTTPTQNNMNTMAPPISNLHEAIDELHSAQISLSYRYAGFDLAGPLLSQIGQLFPQHLMMLYILMDSRRRSTINAFVAKKFGFDPITDTAETRHKLLHWRSCDLLADAYDNVPFGFQTAVERLGVEGQHPHIYQLLHELMLDSSAHQKAFSHASSINSSTVENLARLPVELQSVKLASKINKPADMDKLVFLIKTLANNDQIKFATLCKKVIETVKRDGPLSALLTNVYHKTPFPAPAVPDNDQCRHIHNAFELKKAAHQFRNCLKDCCPEAIRGEYQYYRWYSDEIRPAAVVSIKEDYPHGFRVVEIRGHRNEYLDESVEVEILEYFGKFGVAKMPSIEGLIGEIGCAMKDDADRYDPVDQINDVIDVMLEGEF